ncbi:hypothetical protein C8Q74DRAFT_653320 [Fomes fomentarius]|nr:hypothetical protein C8Q74DRAFT_653320 [Fomes fomentarius]
MISPIPLRVPHSSSNHFFIPTLIWHAVVDVGTTRQRFHHCGVLLVPHRRATHNYVQYATITLLLYEYAITLPAEVNLFWRRRWTGASILFLLNRYVSILFYIPAQTNQFGTSTAATYISIASFLPCKPCSDIFPWQVSHIDESN